MSGPWRESGPGGHLDVKVAELAVRQHGPFTLAQAIEIGFSAQAIYKRAQAGRLHRIHRAVYALVPAQLLSWRGRYMAAVLAAGPGAVLSHRSAADLHELLGTSRARIDVIVARPAQRKIVGIDVHRSRALRAADIVAVDEIPCTSVSRTLLDLAAVVNRERAERALNQAEVLRRLDLGALEDQLERNRRTVAAAHLRAALVLYRPGDAPAESDLERRFIRQVRAAGLPEPERQVRFHCADGTASFLVDFVWRAQRLALETDGRRTHGTAAAFENDRWRDQQLVRAGWRVVRVTWRQLADDPASVVELVADLLATG